MNSTQNSGKHLECGCRNETQPTTTLPAVGEVCERCRRPIQLQIWPFLARTHQYDAAGTTIHEETWLVGIDTDGRALYHDTRANELLTVALAKHPSFDEDVTSASRRERIASGMAYIPEDRQERGLVMDFGLIENALLGSQHSQEFGPGGRIDWPATREHAEAIIDEYDVRPPDPEAGAESLSGGNQQKFIVGREFERDPKLVVASHPTRGVDVGSIEFIHERLLELRRQGVAVLLVSSKLEEVQGLSDRLAVMYEGEFSGVVDPADTTEEELGLLMAGEQPDSVDERIDSGTEQTAAADATGGEGA